MFFYLSKIITFLIDPLFLILALLAIFLVRGTKKPLNRLILMSVFLILYMASTGFFANTLLVRLERAVQPSPLAAHYDAIIVLSGMAGIQNNDDDRIEFSGAVDRILTGIHLIKSGKADFLIISGGDGSLTQHNRPEALLLEEFALQWGVKKEQILIDYASRNTYENAVMTAELLEDRNLNKRLLITSAFHMFRSRGCFNQVGLNVDVYPVDYMGNAKEGDFRGFLPSSDSLAKTNLVIHEVVGILAYRIAGRADYTFMQ